MKNSGLFFLRILIGIGAPLLTAGGLLILYLYGSPFPCVFYSVTGLYCPGCGAGRALTSLVHGDILSALRYNVFFIVAFPVVTYYFLKMYIRFVFRRDPLPMFNISLTAYNRIMIATLVFWVLRNISFVPFSYLAPR